MKLQNEVPSSESTVQAIIQCIRAELGKHQFVCGPLIGGYKTSCILCKQFWRMPGQYEYECYNMNSLQKKVWLNTASGSSVCCYRHSTNDQERNTGTQNPAATEDNSQNPWCPLASSAQQHRSHQHVGKLAKIVMFTDETAQNEISHAQANATNDQVVNEACLNAHAPSKSRYALLESVKNAIHHSVLYHCIACALYA